MNCAVALSNVLRPAEVSCCPVHPGLQLLRVLSTKAAEAGSHADELRQLLGALDFSRWFERSMA